MKIMYLTANAQFAEPPPERAKGPDLSAEYAALDLWPELERVTNTLFESRCEGRVELEVVPEVKRSDIPRYLGERTFDVVHFSGHGDRDQPLDQEVDGATEHQLVFMDVKHEGMFGRYVPNEWLKEQLEGRGIKLLVLNCCWSGGVAERLKGVADCIIGTTIALRLDLAADFSELLYSALDEGRTLGEIKTMLSKDPRFENLYVFEVADDAVLSQSIAPVPEDERDMSPARLVLAKRNEFLGLRDSIGSRSKLEGFKFLVAAIVAWGIMYLLTSLQNLFPGYEDYMAWEPWALFTALAGHPFARVVGFVLVFVGTASMSKMLLALSLKPPVAIERELSTGQVDEALKWVKGCFDVKLPAGKPDE